MAEKNQDLDDDKVINADHDDDDIEDDDDIDGDSGDAKISKEGEENEDGSVTVDPDATGTDEELEKKRAARRIERKERKEQQRAKTDKLRRELESARAANRELEQRVATIEQRNSGSEIAQVDVTLKNTLNAYNYHKQQLAQATETSNGSLMAEATEKMILAKQRLDHLNNIKTTLTNRQNEPRPLDNRLVNHAAVFMEKHPWYKTDGIDNASSITRAIDNSLFAEGWDPRTPEYWDELTDRVKKHLPDKAGRANVTPSGGSRQKSVVPGSGRDSAASGGQSSGQFKLSAERVAALKDAGIWDDDKKRQEAIKRYRDYDRNGKRS